ncbi:MAG TPA: hypothetical protein VGM38_01925 [Pseudolysinimonas sp.]|jgi:hypothetical protein
MANHPVVSTPADFDFVFGDWVVRHRCLTQRLAGPSGGQPQWFEFDGTMTTRPILGGFGNLEENVLSKPGDEYRAVALRSFDAASGTWAIWWLDGRAPHQLDVPVIGAFVDGVGTFYADDTLDGRPIRIRFVWSRQSADELSWEQAFSADGGESWELNWQMAFTRAG